MTDLNFYKITQITICVFHSLSDDTLVHRKAQRSLVNRLMRHGDKWREEATRRYQQPRDTAFHQGKISQSAGSNVHDTWWVLYWSAATDTQSLKGRSASSDSAVNMCQPSGRPASTCCTKDVQLPKAAVFFFSLHLHTTPPLAFSLFVYLYVVLCFADVSETSCLVQALTNYQEEVVNLG